MPKDPRQGTKLLFIKDCFEHERDEDGAMTLQDIKRFLTRRNVSVSKDETITEAIQITQPRDVVDRLKEYMDALRKAYDCYPASIW